MNSYTYKVIIRNILKFFFIFPINQKKFLFVSYNSKQISDSPLCIARFLRKKIPDGKYFMVYSGNEESTEFNVIKPNSFRYFYHIITSKVIVTNNGLPAYLPFRKKQIIIDTFHGGGAYKCFNKTDKFHKYDDTLFKSLDYYVSHLNYFISSNRKLTELVMESDGIPENKFLPIGMPRNDIFFDIKAVEKINLIVRKKLCIPEDAFVLLYAPTYRGLAKDSKFESDLDAEMLRNSLEKKYEKKAFLLFRGHHSFKQTGFFKDFDLDVSDYPDMQDILCCTDFLLTDYSSSIWDYSFLKRPSCLYATDIDEFIETRGFYTSPYSWHFRIAKTNDELRDIILNFDIEEYMNNMKLHHDDLDCYENGEATKKVCEIILKNIIME